MVNKIFNDIKSILSKQGKDVSYIYLKQNKADYTINFFNTAAIKIKLGKKNFIYIKYDAEKLPIGLKCESLKSMPGFSRFEFDYDDVFYKLSGQLTELYDKSVTVQESFGCCNSFELFSDELKCINKDQILARGCMYREHLESGRVFYGKNRNV